VEEVEEASYPRTYQSSDSEDETKLVDMLHKVPEEKTAPLRIHVQLVKGGPKIDALIDTGAPKSLVNGSTLAANTQCGRKLVSSSTTFKAMSGEVTSDGSTVVQFHFPKLNATAKVTHRFEVLQDSPDPMVIGHDLLNALGMVINFKDRVVQWDGYSAQLNTGVKLTAADKEAFNDQEFPDECKEVTGDGVKPSDLMPPHLTGEIAAKYLNLIEQYQKLYDGRLGHMQFPDYELPLSSDFKPTHAKPYAIPRSMEEKAKAAIQRLLDLDVLEQVYDSEMASPAFSLTKANGSLRLLVDFRWLNKFLRRSPYFVPKIREILLRLAGAKCMTTRCEYGLLCSPHCEAKPTLHCVLPCFRQIPVQVPPYGDFYRAR
jgi:hypothetical protein